jgi:hypothetical protein
MSDDTHWHARAATDSFADELVSDDPFGALNYLLPELRDAAQVRWRDAEIAAALDRFKRAWEDARLTVQFRELADTIEKLVDEHRRPWQFRTDLSSGDTEHDSDHRLLMATTPLIARLNRGDDGPHGFRVYPCMKFECSLDDEGERRDLAAARVATTSEE